MVLTLTCEKKQTYRRTKRQLFHCRAFALCKCAILKRVKYTLCFYLTGHIFFRIVVIWAGCTEQKVFFWGGVFVAGFQAFYRQYFQFVGQPRGSTGENSNHQLLKNCPKALSFLVFQQLKRKWRYFLYAGSLSTAS